MQITPYTLRLLTPPKDDLHNALLATKMKVREGDVVAISSKVVAIGEGRTLPIHSIKKEELITQEADWYLRAPKTSKYRRIFTIAGGVMVGSAGIDESNGAGFYILYPKDPMKSARDLRTWLMRTYAVKNVGVLITDSTSIPLRRGALGFALGWSGFEPLRDYRGTPDLFDRTFRFEVANVADSLAAAANIVMGEGSEQTPLAVIRDVPNLVFTTVSKKKGDTLRVDPEEDVFAPVFFGKKWKSRKK